MLSGREEKSMESYEAKVVLAEDKFSIEIYAGSENIIIPMSEENPAGIKMAFNKIIQMLTTVEFEIHLIDVGEDLFSQVALEYITQLNSEIKGVYEELRQFGFLKTV